jgi:hypothetical protein
MQEPQYTNHTIRILMIKIAEANLPCLSIMNMPPLPYLKWIRVLADIDLEEAYTNVQVWERFKPGLVWADPARRDALHRSSRMAHPTCRHFPTVNLADLDLESD